MNSPKHACRPARRVPVTAWFAGAVSAGITGVVVSRLTPDGNLVVTSVPALVVGSAVLGIAVLLLRWRRK